MVKAILFDFWGTLVENGVWSPIKQVKRIINIHTPFSEYVVRMEKAMMTQKFSSLKDAFESVCKEFGVECGKEQIEDLVGMWNKSWMLAAPYSETEESLKKLRENYKIILISNTDCFSIPKVMEKFNLFDYFDDTFLSCDEGMIKTEKKFLKTLLDRLELNVEDCVLVGDSILSDVKAAEEIGMKAILIDRNNRRTYNPKINNLKELEKHL